MNNLILVRHGQSLWNLEKRFTGWADIDLTNQGKFEAENSGKLIKELNIDFDVCFTSRLKRAMNTLQIILKILNKVNLKTNKAWELNERHYGALTSLNKDETTKKYGIKQVKLWRRSFDVRPPEINISHPYINKIFNNIPKNQIPNGESLMDTFNRVVPYYTKEIEPLLQNKKNILAVFHGNSIRALLKKLFNISKKRIVEFEIPTGNPLLIKFNDNLKIIDCKYLDKKRKKKILFNV